MQVPLEAGKARTRFSPKPPAPEALPGEKPPGGTSPADIDFNPCESCFGLLTYRPVNGRTCLV